MAGEGTRIGTGYVEIQADFDRFQREVEKKLAQVFAKSGAGKQLSKAFSRDLSKGAKTAEGDMFGLSERIRGVDKDSNRASRSAKALAGDMFGVASAAKRGGRVLESASSQLRNWHTHSENASGSTRRLSGIVRTLAPNLRKLGREAKVAAGGFGSINGFMARANRSASFFGNALRTIRLPAFVAGLGLAAQALSALAAGAVATTSALAPLAGLLVALPAAAAAAAQGLGVIKLATAGLGDAIKSAIDLQAKGGEQATQALNQQRDAAAQVADSKRSLADAQRQEKFSQEDLTKARKEATRQLQDMRLASEASRDSEESATLGLQQARAELQKTLRDPTASQLDVRVAEEAVDQARGSLESTRIEAKRARQDYADAQKKGVDGMPEVVAAKRSEEDATRAVAGAQRDLKRAVEDSTTAMEDQGSASTAFQQKMSELPVAGRRFVRFIVGLKPKLDQLRATAAKGLLPGLERGIGSALRNFGPIQGIIAKTSKLFGGLAESAGKKLGSAEWGKDLKQLGSLNVRILGRMGKVAFNFADALLHILIAAEPFLDWLSKSAVSLSEWIEGESEAGKTGELATFFDHTRQAMELLGPIIKGVGGALKSIGEAARPLGNEILKALGDSAEGFREWTDTTEGKNSLATYFKESKPAIFEAGKLIGAVVKSFFELGKQRGVAHLLQLIRTELLPAITEMTGAVTGFVSDFLKQFGNLRKEGKSSFEAFLTTLADHAGRAGKAIAKALWGAFRGASIWGKVAIGAFLLSKFAPEGTLAKIGAFGAELGWKLGKRLFESAAAWIAGTESTSGFLGWFQAATGPNGKLGKAAGVGGGRVGKTFGRAFTLGAIVGITLLAPAIRDAVDKLIINPVNNALHDLLGNKVGDIVETAQHLIDPAEGGPLIAGAGKVFGFSVKDFTKDKILDLDKLVTGQDKAGKKLDDFARHTGEAGRRAKEGFRNHVDRLPEIADASGKGINRKMQPELKRLVDDGGDKGVRFNERISGAFGSLAGNVGAAIQNIIKNTGGGLKALSVKDVPNFKVTPMPQEGFKELFRQRGGPVPAFASGGLAGVVPGNITGDRRTLSIDGKPVARVESKEGIFVGNRRMMGVLDRVNERFPRFGKFASGGALAGVGSGERNLATTLLNKFGGYISSGLRPEDSDSFHSEGKAADWVGGDWKGAARFVNSIGSSLLEGIYNPEIHGGPPVSWDSGSKQPSSFWGAETWAAHNNHIHTAIEGGFKALKPIVRQILKGPAGPLKDLGQAAIDKVWKAASKLGGAGGGFKDNFKVPAGVLDKGQLKSLWHQVNPKTGDANLMAAIAMAESGGNPTVTNSIGARGLWQIIPSTADAFGLDYGKLTDAAYNALGAAKILRGQGLTAWETYTNGAYSQYLQRGGPLNLMGLTEGGDPEGKKKGKGGLGPFISRNVTAGFKKDFIEKIKGRLKGLKTAGLGKGLLGKLMGSDDAVETLSEYASNAGSLTTEGPSGEEILGTFQGQDEGHWLKETLSNLLTLRNLLLNAKEQVEAVRQKIVEQLKAAFERVKQVKETIQKEQKRRTQLAGQLDSVRAAIDKSTDPDEKRALRIQARDLQDQISQVDSQQADRRLTLGQMVSKLIPGLKDKRTELGETVRDILGQGGDKYMGLARVQGLSGPLNTMTDVPAIGALGGEILNVQSRLRDLGLKPDKGGEDDDSERADIFEKLFRDEQGRRFASDAEKVALQGWDELRQGIMAGLPKFHVGGIVPGPRGAERPIMAMAGEGVFTQDQMGALGEGGLSIENFTVTVHEDGRATAVADDQEFDAEVQRVLRQRSGKGRQHPNSSAFNVR